MSLKEKIEKFRDYPTRAPEAFREQLERAQRSRELMDNKAPVAPKGIDRSGELTPLPRPTIVRTLVDPRP